MKPKVGLVNVFFPPQSIGGATRVVADNLAALKRLHGDRFEFFVITSDNGSQRHGSLQPYVLDGTPVYRIGIQHRVNMDWHPSDDVVTDVVAKIYDQEVPDLMHFHCIQRLGVGVVEAAHRRAIPSCVTVHDAWWLSDYQFLVEPSGRVHADAHGNDFFDYELPNGVSRAESVDRRMRLKSVLNAAQRVFGVSAGFTDLYRRNGIHRAVPNVNGIAAQAWVPRPVRPTGPVVVAHIGGMSDHKGYHLFRAALHEANFSNLAALVVDHSKPWNHVAHECWGSVRVTVVGRVPQAEIAQLFGAIDVLFAPSIWPESFGLVTREARAAGVWVVASNLGGIGEDVIAGVNGHLIDPLQSRPLANVLRMIDSQPDHYRMPCPDGAVRLVDDQVNELVDHYDEMLVASAKTRRI